MKQKMSRKCKRKVKVKQEMPNMNKRLKVDPEVIEMEVRALK